MSTTPEEPREVWDPVDPVSETAGELGVDAFSQPETPDNFEQ